MFRKLTLLALCTAGCLPVAYVRRPLPPPPPPPALERSSVASEDDPVRFRVVEAGRESLTRVHGPGDCVAYVRSLYHRVGRTLPDASLAGDNAVTGLYRAIVAAGQAFRGELPRPGDLAFFEETYDRNRDGQRNDGLTHVAVVESVDGHGTVLLLHRGSRGATRVSMDLSRPDLERDAETGRVLNQPLRRFVPEGAPRLTGQLFYAYGRVLAPSVRPDVARAELTPASVPGE